MDSYTDPNWSQSLSTLATTTARDDDDEVTVAGGPRRITGSQLLIMTPDDVRNTKFLGSEDGTNLQYTVTTKSINSGPKACMESVVTDYMGHVVGVYTAPLTSYGGSELITLGNDQPTKRKTWLSTGGPFDKVIGKFDHAGFTYKWTIKESKGLDVTMELYSNNPTDISPIARFISSRHASTGKNMLDATLALNASGAAIRDLCIFSFVVTDRIRMQAKSRQRGAPPRTTARSTSDGLVAMTSAFAF